MYIVIRRIRIMRISTLLVFLICYGCVCSCFSWSSHEDEEYIDFTDMGSYNHGFQKNHYSEDGDLRRNGREIEELNVKVTRYNYEAPPGIINGDETEYPEGSITTKVKSSEQLELEYNTLKLQNIEIVESKTKFKSKSGQFSGTSTDENAAMKYTKRIVASLLRQMNVGGHVFGPGEAITIDLQAEISHADFMTLNKFIGAVEETSVKHLSEVDTIISNLIHVVVPPITPSVFETLKDGLVNLSSVLTEKFVLGLFSAAVVLFIVILLANRMRSGRNIFHLLTYAFWLYFVLSCVWQFKKEFEKVKAENYARLMQTGDIPSDCEFDRMGMIQSSWYYIRVHLFKYADRCVEYHQEAMVDPFWRVSPTEAISQTFAALIFHPWSYIGTKVGLFLSNASSVFPFWLQPFVVLFLFVFMFMGCFRYKVSTPFFSIEPAGFSSNRNNREREGNMLTESGKVESIQQENEQAQQQQVVEKQAGEIVEVKTRDVSTDMSDFEEYIRLTTRRTSQVDDEPPDEDVPELPNSPSRSIFSFLSTKLKNKYPFILLIALFDICLSILDKTLRQVPFIQDSHVISADCVIP